MPLAQWSSSWLTDWHRVCPRHVCSELSAIHCEKHELHAEFMLLIWGAFCSNFTILRTFWWNLIFFRYFSLCTFHECCWLDYDNDWCWCKPAFERFEVQPSVWTGRLHHLALADVTVCWFSFSCPISDRDWLWYDPVTASTYITHTVTESIVGRVLPELWGSFTKKWLGHCDWRQFEVVRRLRRRPPPPHCRNNL